MCAVAVFTCWPIIGPHLGPACYDKRVIGSRGGTGDETRQWSAGWPLVQYYTREEDTVGG